MSPTHMYKQMVRRIRKLPFDPATVSLAQATTKQVFLSQKNTSKTRYNSTIQLLDTLLVNEIYSNIPVILDLFVKATPEWMSVYKTMKVSDVAGRLPKVHLIDQITTDKKLLQAYHQEFDLQDRRGAIPWPKSLVEDVNSTPLLYVSLHHSRPSSSPDALFDAAIASMLENYAFLLKHQKALSRLMIQPLDIVYPLSSMGTPLPSNRLRKVERKAVALVSKVLEQHRPVRKDHLEMLHRFCISSGWSNINPAFFKSIAKKRKHREDSPLFKRYLQERKHMPSPNSVRKVVREYVLRQYYWDEVSHRYCLSPMNDFYQASQSKATFQSL